MKKRRSVLIIAGVLIVILTGCLEKVRNFDLDQELGLGDKQEAGMVAGVEDTGPAQGGFLNLFLLQPDTLNPLTTGNTSVRELSMFLFDSLFSEKTDGTIACALADSYSVSSDGLILDIQLKDNIYFHDGLSLTSDDVAFTVETIKQAGTSSQYFGNVANIKDIKTTGRLSFRIIFEKAEGLTGKLIFPIVPEHVFKDWPVAGYNDSLKPIGTGPFKLDSYGQGVITLLRNDSWWNLEADGGLSHPIWLEGIHFKIYSDESEMLEAFQKQEIDIAALEEGNIDSYANRSDIFVKQYESNILEFLALSNIGRTGSAISQEKFRELLISYLEWYGSIHETNWGAPAFQLFSEPDPAEAEISRETILEAFREAGYTYQEGKNNVLTFYKNGANVPVFLSLRYNQLNEDRKLVSDWIREALSEIGIEVIPEKASYEEQQASVQSGKFDMILLGCRLPLATDKSKVIELIKESIHLSGQDSVVLPLYRKHGIVLYQNRIRGNKTPLWHNIYHGWSEWYIVR